MTPAHCSKGTTTNSPERRAARLLEIEHRMRGGLAREVLDLRSLTESLVAAPAGERSERLQELEHAAHRLRGRAATLRLSALCTAAAALERLATTSAPAESLRLALAHCERALAQLSPS